MDPLTKSSIIESKLSLRFAKDRVAFLDAGLGTTLEDVLHKDISHPLWSAHLIEVDPEAIIEAHLAFFKAGASIISTATYQCSAETFARAGYVPRKGNDIMHQAVRLAVQARDRFMQAAPNNGAKPKIALSLGPYGATLSPAAEFSGIYPAPYGPSEPGSSLDSPRKEQAAEDALMNFHLDRLRIFASLPETWNTIDIIAFETVPLLREARAIRRAMTLLANTALIPPWWISFNFAEGVLVERDSNDNHYTAADCVRVCFERTGQLAPSAFGINCTHTKYVKACLQAASHELDKFPSDYFGDTYRASSPGNLGKDTGPALVLYPNGGHVYVPSTMTWLPPSPHIPELDGLSEAQIWAKKLVVAVVESVPRETRWSRLIIGGCCKTEPDYVSSLVELL